MSAAPVTKFISPEDKPSISAAPSSTETPRVDSEVVDCTFPDGEFVSAGFARQLERELRAANKEWGDAMDRLGSTLSSTDAIVAEFRGKSIHGLAIRLSDHARFLKGDVARWKRLYECAQNANAYRQDALDAEHPSATGTLDELVKDASRYRWLRGVDVHKGHPLPERFWELLGDAVDEEFDTQIDEAMKP